MKKWLLLSLACYLPVVHADDIGQFAPSGYVGPMAETLTFIQAQGKCLNEAGVGSSLSTSSTPLFDSSFKDCMKDYVPFRSSDSDSGNACGTQTVSWGQCSGVSNPLETGNSAFIQNTLNTNDYTGYANFMCADGQMIFMSGGCARTTDACEEGAIEQWPVTFPAWADADPDTVYVDKYGQVRDKPQSNCAASLPAADSGDFIVQSITSDVVDTSRYTSGSKAPLRCFNAEWDLEPPESAVCEVAPKGCAARSINYNGCSFDVPATAHDQIFSDVTPNPVFSVGHVETYCFDGELEIKQQSCALSCDANQEATTWNPDDASVAQNCAHSAVTGRARIPSGTTQLITNNVAGMDGSITRQCVNGVMGVVDTSCAPQTCTDVPANTWGDGGKCAHVAQNIPSEHGEGNITIPSNDLFGASGSVTYSCEFGEYVEVSSECSGAYASTVLCSDSSISLPPETPDDPNFGLDPDYCELKYNRTGMVRVGDICCTGRATDLNCYEVP